MFVCYTYMGSERVAKNGSHVSLAQRKGFVLGKSKKTNIVKKSKREKTRYYRKREWELGIAGVCASERLSLSCLGFPLLLPPPEIIPWSHLLISLISLYSYVAERAKDKCMCTE